MSRSRKALPVMKDIHLMRAISSELITRQVDVFTTDNADAAVVTCSAMSPGIAIINDDILSMASLWLVKQLKNCFREIIIICIVDSYSEDLETAYKSAGADVVFCQSESLSSLIELSFGFTSDYSKKQNSHDHEF